MIAVLVPLNEGSLLLLLLLLSCIASTFLRLTERWFNLAHMLHRWCIGWGIAIGSGIFLFTVWHQLPQKQDVRVEQIGAGVVAGLIAALALAFLIPPVLFLYYYLLPRGKVLWINRQSSPKGNPSLKEARRREDARARCEIQFNLHAPELGERFTRQMFDDFVARHMGDNCPPEDVESRADQLLQVIRQHADKGSTGRKDLSIAERAKHLDEQVRQIQDSNLVEREKETLIIMLKRQFMTGLQQEIEGP